MIFAEVLRKQQSQEMMIQQLSGQLRNTAEFTTSLKNEADRKLVSYFKSSYPTVAGDAVLSNMANERTKVLQAENPHWSKEEVVDQAGKDVMAWLGKNVPESAPTARVEKKHMPRQPKKAGGRLPPKPEEKPKTRKDYVRELREQRGMTPS